MDKRLLSKRSANTIYYPYLLLNVSFKISIKALLCCWLNKSSESSSTINKFYPIICVGTSNRPTDIDDCFRCGGRFEKEIEVLGTSGSDKNLILRKTLTTSSLFLSVCKLHDEKSKKEIEEGRNEEDEKILDDVCARLIGSLGGYVASDIVALISAACTLHSTEKWLQWKRKNHGESQINIFE